MKIISVDKGSIAETLGVQGGDILHKINGQPVKDVLDYRYHVTDEAVELEIERDGERTIYEIEKEIDDTLGLNLEPIKIRMCGNDCVFCFVDQNPANMRQTMYLRDEDYRLSFLAGHYVTLTNLAKRDLDRIVVQRLTPLYVSVHATEPEIRKFLLGIRHDDKLSQKLDFLAAHGIEMHTQIVVCPTFNDGEVLNRTIADLAHYHPHIRTVALVPLGLTRHREGLTPLVPVTREYAQQLLVLADEYARDYMEKLGTYFVYPSDEFYIKAGVPIPGRDRYDTFEQLENGVGMVRTLLDEFDAFKAHMPRAIAKTCRITLVTATLMAEIMRDEIVSVLAAVENLDVDLVVVENKFYGNTIGVSGLLTAQDIFAALQSRDNGDRVYLPANCLNDDGVFLDDWSLAQLETKLGTAVRTIRNDFTEIFRDIEGWCSAA